MDILTFSTDEELKDLLSGNLEEQECILTTKAIPKCTKKSRETKEPYDEIFSKEIVCVTTRKVIVGANYRDLLSRYSESIEGEGVDRDPMQLPWGEWVSGSNSLIAHKETFYFRVYGVEKGSEKCYIYNDGSRIEEDRVSRLSEFLPTSREGDEQKVIVNNLKLNTITKLEFNDRILERK